MERPDFKKLNKTVEILQNRDGDLELALEIAAAQRKAVIREADTLCKIQALRQMREVPVEELNRNRQGFRIALLRQKGYQTVADVVMATTQMLDTIDGIGSYSAARIHKAAEDLCTAAEQAVTIRLNPEQRDDESDHVVRALYRLIAANTFSKEAEPLYRGSHDAITQALSGVSSASGRLSWMLLTSAKKESVISAAAKLEELRSGDYLSSTTPLLQAFRDAMGQTPEQAWQAFNGSSAAYYALLEELCPGRVERGGATAGLPAELVEQVAKQPVDTAGLKCTLRKYQKFGVQYALSQRNVLLGDEMGLGKTVQAIGTMVALQAEGAVHFVVVCPAGVVENWCREVEKHSSLKAYKIHGSAALENRRLWLKNGGVAVTNYESIAKLALPENFRFSLLVADEAHYAKNPGAMRTQLLLRLKQKADRLLFMTGTPLENNVDEMCNLVSYLQPEVSTKLKELRERSAAPQFRDTAAGVYFRRTREDVMQELPELIESREWCTLGKEEYNAYFAAAMDRQFMAMRQVSWNVSDVTKSSKAQRLREIVEEAKNQGRRVLVFSYFTNTIRQAGLILGDVCYGPINGSVSTEKRQQIIDEFAKSPVGSVLLAQIQAGGTGLNIQSASVVVICEPQLKPSIEVQAVSRAYRMGQVRSVLVYRLLCADTIDERILELLEEKQDIFDHFAAESVSGQESLNCENRSFLKLAEAEMERLRSAAGDELAEKFDAKSEKT